MKPAPEPCALCQSKTTDMTRITGMGWVCTSRISCFLRVKAERDELRIENEVLKTKLRANQSKRRSLKAELAKALEDEDDED